MKMHLMGNLKFMNGVFMGVLDRDTPTFPLHYHEGISVDRDNKISSDPNLTGNILAHMAENLHDIPCVGVKRKTPNFEYLVNQNPPPPLMMKRYYLPVGGSEDKFCGGVDDPMNEGRGEEVFDFEKCKADIVFSSALTSHFYSGQVS